MPFNMAMAGVGGRAFVLSISAEDLAIAYDIESQIASAYPSAAPTRAGDKIQLNIAAVDLVAASASGYAIDGNGLHNDALLTISLTSGAWISGRGGAGGIGGNGDWDPEPPASDDSTVGGNGNAGGTALRLGCETNIIGTGTIIKGFGGGGGGGGGAISLGTRYGGGGGGGGAPLGTGGAGGAGASGAGVAGGTGTNTADGGGGAAGGAQAGAGGDGGDTVAAAANGSSGTKAGGAAGSDGAAIDSQAFTHSEAGGITVTGDII